jgi:hypothetical protein
MDGVSDTLGIDIGTGQRHPQVRGAFASNPYTLKRPYAGPFVLHTGKPIAAAPPFRYSPTRRSRCVTHPVTRDDVSAVGTPNLKTTT